MNSMNPVNHLIIANSLLKKVENATGYDVASGNCDRWIQEASAHALIAIGLKLITK